MAGNNESTSSSAQFQQGEGKIQADTSGQGDIDNQILNNGKLKGEGEGEGDIENQILNNGKLKGKGDVENQILNDGKLKGKGEGEGENQIKDEGILNARNTVALVAILIATIAFTAGISPPGGIHQEGQHIGKAIASTRTSFKIFSHFNSIGLFASLYIVVLMGSIYPLNARGQRILFVTSKNTMRAAVICMAAAYLAALWVVLPPDQWTWWCTLSITCFIFFVLFIIWVNMIPVRMYRRRRRQKKISKKKAEEVKSEIERVTLTFSFFS